MPDSALTKITMSDNCRIGKEGLDYAAAQTDGSNLHQFCPGHPFYVAYNT